MSEQLLYSQQRNIGKYKYLPLGEVTIKQLMESGLIPKKKYVGILTKKPDGIIFYHKEVKAIIEYKQPSKLRSEADIKKAIEQEIEVAKQLCKILIITDGKQSYWINALNGERIKDTKGNEITETFNTVNVKNVNVIEYLIEEIDSSISESNSQIRSYQSVDPSPLATKLWQTIWAATGKSPVKCLYNVVELFIFKFLSDLKILPEDIAFDNVYRKSTVDPEDALDYYARNTRVRIRKLFPKGKDGTTIINGTIFVTENGEANLSQSYLFAYSLRHLQEYGEEFGSLTKINKQFKTKLYESFLKQEVEALGQYFTPRVIIQSVLRMAGMNEPTFSFNNKRICDPFCGVGGFLLELLNLNENMMAAYQPDSNGKINVPFVLNGFDKGFERDDERTIILAKANMLIYLAEILFRNPNCTEEFAKIFNNTFRLFRDNLGTFGYIEPFEDDSKKYDYILSNPPYVISGTRIIKEELKKTSHTKNQYSINAVGLESIALEWIIKSLKPGGQAYLIIPDGILGRSVTSSIRLRKFILKECFLDAIVSLPIRTFFANFEHTYILALTKKHNNTDTQSYPVFTYLVSDIGEKLTSVKREPIDSNDLPEMERLYQIYKAVRLTDASIVEKESKRCKIIDIGVFKRSTHWVIDRWWSESEKIELGIIEQPEKVSKQDIDTALKEFSDTLKEYEAECAKVHKNTKNFIEVALGDQKLFSLSIGKRVLKKELVPPETKDAVPVYSANAVDTFGYVVRKGLSKSKYDTILWGIDGNFNFSLIRKGSVYITTDHCGKIDILREDILPEYLLYALNESKNEENFDRSFRASLANMKQFKVKLPITKEGSFDINEQKRMAESFIRLQELKAKLQSKKDTLNQLVNSYAK